MPGLLTEPLRAGGPSGPEAEIDTLPVDGEILDGEDLADAVGPELETPAGVDRDEVIDLLWQDLIRGEHAKAVVAEAQMRQVIEYNQSLDHRMQQGLGQLVARIPLSVFMHWTARYGPEFWDQPDTLEFFEKRAGGGRGNPGFIVKTKGRPTIVKSADFPRSVRGCGIRVNGTPGAILTNAPGATAPPAASVI